MKRLTMDFSEDSLEGVQKVADEHLKVFGVAEIFDIIDHPMQPPFWSPFTEYKKPIQKHDEPVGEESDRRESEVPSTETSSDPKDSNPDNPNKDGDARGV